jgi:ATP-binding cassette subfamily C (CFTR/MRP) protein 1
VSRHLPTRRHGIDLPFNSTQFIESIEGITTLRAFGWQSRCITDNISLVDNSQKPFYLIYMLQKWLSLVIDLVITALAVLVVGIAVVIRNRVSVGFTGVSLSQIISLTSYMKLIILFWTQMEMSLGAVSRIKTFSEEAGDENLTEEDYDPPKFWPSHGALDIKDLCVTYN